MLCWLTAAAAAAPTAAQVATAREPVTVVGQVVERETQAPIAHATVELPALRLGTLTDARGRFSFSGVPPGAHALIVRQVGYVGEELVWQVTAENPPLRIALIRDPVALAGIEVMVDRFEARRRAHPRSVRSFDRPQLHDAIGRNMLDFIGGRGGVTLRPCFGAGTSTCIWHRGRPVRPTVYMDEVPFFGGLDDLASYYPHEIHSVEVLGGGRQIRIYTIWFMDQVARRPRALMPYPIW